MKTIDIMKYARILANKTVKKGINKLLKNNLYILLHNQI